MCLEEPSSDAMADPLSSCFTVGKTSLITRFMYDSFDNTYQVRSWEPLFPFAHGVCSQDSCLETMLVSLRGWLVLR